MKVIDISNLSKSYKELKAVNDVSLTITKGEIFGMLGPNGAGKTTTIECVTGLKEFDAGSVEILNVDIKDHKKKLYNIIGVQLQETIYQDKIKVKEICELFQEFYKDPLDYKALLKRFGLEEKLNSYVSKISGGQRQKLSIILSLIGNPEIVFLDELTTGLDPNARRDMWKYIEGLREEGRTVFMTTHYMEEAEFLCDRICLIKNGEIIACDTVEEIIKLSDIPNEVTFLSENPLIKEYLGELSDIEHIDYVNGEYRVSSKNDMILTNVVLKLHEKEYCYSQLNIKRPTLDDAYIKLTGGESDE